MDGGRFNLFRYAKCLNSVFSSKVRLERVDRAVVGAVADVLGAQEHVDEQVTQRVAEFVARPITVQRLIDVIPEAFGLAFISRMPETRNTLVPNTFLVMDNTGDWSELPMFCEPIFEMAFSKARHTFDNGPRTTVENNCNRSALISALSAALNANASLDGATFAPPAFADLPASLYK
jgi:hypothetical protein